jgi:prepilin-type processing-associated H-X9-DG protein
MRYLILALIPLFSCAPALAHEDADDIALLTSTDLRDWCQRESEARLIAESKTPSNWTARHYEKGNTLMVDGRWRADGVEIEVSCRVGRGARARFATVALAPRK